jgi:hypothetical protein
MAHFFGSFAKFRKTNIGFDISIRMKRIGSTNRFSLDFILLYFSKNFQHNSSFNLNLTIIRGTSFEDMRVFVIYH